jgi:NOL1/NOP2/sun family putative RNA methylase
MIELFMKYTPKPEFVERLKKLMHDYEKFLEIVHTPSPDAIRCNTLKISPEKLKERLEKRGWKMKQPFSEFPEVMIIENFRNLQPGELGKTKEHLLGYYYVQEIASMLPLLALKPQPGDIILDLCASPGSKTTQAAAMMKNQGTIIANDNDIGRIAILSANLEKCGVMNTIVTKRDGVQLCMQIRKDSQLRFDKILVDAPCSGEGTLRKSPKTFLTWNLKMIKVLSGIQKKLSSEALKILKVNGEMIYSTCTLAPEEDEEVIDFLKRNFDIEIQEIKLPIQLRCGVCEWESQKYSSEVQKACRLYPQDENTEGFFLCKIKKLSDKCLLEDRR